MDQDSRTRIELLCEQLDHWPDVREVIQAGGAGGQLDELTELLRSTGSFDPGHLIALLDAIEEAAAREGLVGVTSRPRGPVPDLPHGMHSAHTVGWTCPLRRCTRVVLFDESRETPTCATAHADANQMTAYPSAPGQR